ncbi:polysaccharide biosynthesis C-terminal domain-containing protein [Maritalea sp. S77]|uniref:polysaccharide biosynthesis C-terminal domain-containing protein n=1 Tax=Maritalea sp. S77 TaxID=3415125 RepID=UPI003C7AB8A0
MKFILASSAITSVCLAFIFLFAQDQLNQQMHGSVIVLLVGLPVLALELYVEGVARAHGRYLLGIVPGYVLRPIAVMAILFGLRFAGVQLTAEVALAAVILSTLLLVAMQGAVLWRSINKTQQKVAPKRLKRLKMMWIKASLPLVVITGVEELFYWSDVVILGFMVPPAEISIYFAALRVMAITNFIHYAFMFVFAREFSVAHAGGDADFLRRKVTTASSWTFWLTVPAIVLILLSGPLLLSMFGEEFLSGQVIMLVIGIGILGKSLVGPAANLLIVTGYARQSVVISFVALITNVVISVTLILFFGIIGAAIGTAIAQIFRSIMIAIYCKQKMSVNVLPTLNPLKSLFGAPKT